MSTFDERVASEADPILKAIASVWEEAIDLAWADLEASCTARLAMSFGEDRDNPI